VRRVKPAYDHYPALHQRLRIVLAVFALLLAIGLAAALVAGDAGGVAAVHRAAWTQGHYEFLRKFTDLGL